MFKFILKRIGYMFVTLWIVATITFMLIHAIPGDPLAAMARKLPAQIKANFYAKYGLDKPVIVQYGNVYEKHCASWRFRRITCLSRKKSY